MVCPTKVEASKSNLFTKSSPAFKILVVKKKKKTFVIFVNALSSTSNWFNTLGSGKAKSWEPEDNLSRLSGSCDSR